MILKFKYNFIINVDVPERHFFNQTDFSLANFIITAGVNLNSWEGELAHV